MKKFMVTAAVIAAALVIGVFAAACGGSGSEELPDPTEGKTASSGLAFTLSTELDAEAVAYENDYTIEGDAYYVLSGIGTCTDTDIVVPSEYEGVPVKAIADSAFFGNANITSVVLPNSIEVIGALAFGRCTGMTSFNCGNGVRIIEHCAFGTAEKMTTFVFSERTEFIGWECFHHAAALTTLNLPKSIKKIDYSIMNGVLFETVNYAGSEEEWKEVDVNSNNSELLGATYNYNAEF